MCLHHYLPCPNPSLNVEVTATSTAFAQLLILTYRFERYMYEDICKMVHVGVIYQYTPNI